MAARYFLATMVKGLRLNPSVFVITTLVLATMCQNSVGFPLLVANQLPRHKIMHDGAMSLSLLTGVRQTAQREVQLSAAGSNAAAEVVTKIMYVPPSLRSIALACLVPSCLGYYKSEYGVSYGYGIAIAALADIIYKSVDRNYGFTPPTFWPGITAAKTHTSVYTFYGWRLCVFLLGRESFVPRMREARDRIEDRAVERGGRLARTPFILICATLYGCLSAPLMLSAKAVGSGRFSVATDVFVHLSFAGFILAAVGDWAKSKGKSRHGNDALITSNVLRYLRHPNYTGESIGWTCSFLAGLSATTAACGRSLAEWKNYLPLLTASLAGLSGILIVLASAGSALELRQKEKYGGMKEYEDWVKSSWAGITLGGWRGSVRRKSIDEDE